MSNVVGVEAVATQQLPPAIALNFIFLPIFLSHRVISKNGKALIPSLLLFMLWWANRRTIYDTLLTDCNILFLTKIKIKATFVCVILHMRICRMSAISTEHTQSNCTPKKLSHCQWAGVSVCMSTQNLFSRRGFSRTKLRKIIKTSEFVCISSLIEIVSSNQLGKEPAKYYEYHIAVECVKSLIKYGARICRNCLMLTSSQESVNRKSTV